MIAPRSAKEELTIPLAPDTILQPRPGRSSRQRPSLILAGAILFASSLAMYVRTAAPTIYALDSSGLTRAAYLVQPAHPPGYPLYVLLGKLFSLAVPIGDMGYRLNLMSAFFAALTLATLFGLLVVLGCRPVAGAAAAVMLGGTYYYWSIATMAEVYSLQAFLIVALVLALVLWRADGRRRWVLLAALLFGLALSNHLTAVLLVPGIVGYSWLVRGRRPPNRPPNLTLSSPPNLPPNRRTWPAALAALCVGPSLYGLVPLRGDLRAPGEMLDFVLARDFWFAVFSYSPTAFAREVSGMSGLLWANFLGAGIVLGLVGLAGAAAADRGLLTLVGGGFAAGFLFFSGYHVADKSLMLAPVLVLWAVWIGLGLNGVLAGLDPLTPSAPVRWTIRLGLLGAAGMVWALNFPLADLSQDWRVRRQAERVLAAVAENAVVFVGSWVDLEPLRYLQDVEAARPDVAVVDVRSPAAARAARGTVDAVLATRPVYTIDGGAVANSGHLRVWLAGCGCYQLEQR